MAKSLRVHTVLPRDPSSVPSTHRGLLTTTCNSSSREIQHLCSAQVAAVTCTDPHTYNEKWNPSFQKQRLGLGGHEWQVPMLALDWRAAQHCVLHSQRQTSFSVSKFTLPLGVHPLSSCFWSEGRPPPVFAEHRQQINQFWVPSSSVYCVLHPLPPNLWDDPSISRHFPHMPSIFFISLWHIGDWTQDLTQARQTTSALCPRTSFIFLFWDKSHLSYPGNLT